MSTALSIKGIQTEIMKNPFDFPFIGKPNYTTPIKQQTHAKMEHFHTHLKHGHHANGTKTILTNSPPQSSPSSTNSKKGSPSPPPPTVKHTSPLLHRSKTPSPAPAYDQQTEISFDYLFTDPNLSPQELVTKCTSEIWKAIPDHSITENKKLQIKFALEKLKHEFTKFHKQTNVRADFFREQVEKRRELLNKQREAYWRELSLLREELFRLKQNPNYDDSNSFLYGDWKDFAAEDANLSKQKEPPKHAFESKEPSIFKPPPKTKQPSEQEKLALEQVQKQQQEVNQLMAELKVLEEQKQREMEALKMEREQFENLKKLTMVEKSARTSSKSPSQSTEEEDASFSELERESLLDVVDDVIDPIESAAMEELVHESTSYSPNHHQHNDLFGPITKEIQRFENRNATVKKLAKSAQLREFDIGDGKEVQRVEQDIKHFQQKFKQLSTIAACAKTRLKIAEMVKKDASRGIELSIHGLAAIVVMDVEDIEQLWNLEPEFTVKTFEVYHQSVKKLVREYYGKIITTEADKYILGFTECKKAVEFGLRINLAFLEMDWPVNNDLVKDKTDHGILFKGPRIKIGIHYSTVKKLSNNHIDLTCATIQHASYLESIAVGGQILCTKNVWDEITTLSGNNVEMEGSYATITVGLFTPLCATTLHFEDAQERRETVKMIVPLQLKNREFVSSVDKKLSSLEVVNQKLLHCQQQLGVLEKEKEEVTHKLSVSLKMKNLEYLLRDKDSIIKHLESKIQEMDQLSTNEEKRKHKLKNELHFVMKKYYEMQDQYFSAKHNYEHVVTMFDKKAKQELETIQSEMKETVQQLEQVEKIPIVKQTQSNIVTFKTNRDSLQQQQQLLPQIMVETPTSSSVSSIHFLEHSEEAKFVRPKTTSNTQRSSETNLSFEIPRSNSAPQQHKSLLIPTITAATTEYSQQQKTIDELSSRVRKSLLEAEQVEAKYKKFQWGITVRPNTTMTTFFERKLMEYIERGSGRKRSAEENFVVEKSLGSVTTTAMTVAKHDELAAPFRVGGQTRVFRKTYSALRMQRRSIPSTTPLGSHIKLESQSLFIDVHGLVEQLFQGHPAATQFEQWKKEKFEKSIAKLIDQHSRTIFGKPFDEFNQLPAHEKRREILYHLFNTKTEKLLEEKSNAALLEPTEEVSTEYVKNDISFFKYDTFANLGIVERSRPSTAPNPSSVQVSQVVGLKSLGQMSLNATERRKQFDQDWKRKKQATTS